MLQQYLPLAVLKLTMFLKGEIKMLEELQQYLPLAVLKLKETDSMPVLMCSCNSTYRLRY